MKCNIPKKICNARDGDECRLGIECLPVVDKCLEENGCDKVDHGYCRSYTNPEIKWKLSKVCPAATHIKTEAQKRMEKIRIGQQKQRRRR
jgi:hypothetical protein